LPVIRPLCRPAGKRPDTNQRASIGCNIKWRES
jgi:hypothetical protein